MIIRTLEPLRFGYRTFYDERQGGVFFPGCLYRPDRPVIEYSGEAHENSLNRCWMMAWVDYGSKIVSRYCPRHDRLTSTLVVEQA